MSTELCPTLPGRPPTIVREGVTIFLSVHDTAFQARVRELRASMVQAHPDKGGTPNAFRRAMASLHGFLFAEYRIYAAWGVEPPAHRASKGMVAYAKLVGAQKRSFLTYSYETGVKRTIRVAERPPLSGGRHAARHRMQQQRRARACREEAVCPIV